jgi:hypothetical protein
MDTITDRTPTRTRASRRRRTTPTLVRRGRPVVGVAVSVAALGAVTGVAAIVEHGAERDPVHGVVGRPSATSVSDRPTELDVHGIPTWWSGGGSSG